MGQSHYERVKKFVLSWWDKNIAGRIVDKGSVSWYIEK